MSSESTFSQSRPRYSREQIARRRRAVEYAGAGAVAAAVVLGGPHLLAKAAEKITNDKQAHALEVELTQPIDKVMDDYDQGKIDHSKVVIVKAHGDDLVYQEALDATHNQHDPAEVTTIMSTQNGGAQVGPNAVFVLPKADIGESH